MLYSEFKCQAIKQNASPSLCIEGIVFDIVKAHKSAMKKALIIDEVSVQTGVDKEELVAPVTEALNKLKSKGKIGNPKHGYWV